jgi:RNA polymerase sigma-70 factor, ECF subfamily
VAQPTPSSAPAPSPVHPGAGRAARLPDDPGRATELLYKRHGRTVLRYAWHLLGRREDAEDATQATFLAVHSALGGGTAVLEPRAWVLRIARNECMGRLRQTARMPASGAFDGAVDSPTPVGVEHTAEVRDELRTARRALRALPVPEREAFVLREWLGLETGEVALALGLTAGDVEGLAGRARRSLVLAVGGLEPALGCAGTRVSLEAGSLDRAGRVHLLRCPMCRGVRRALRAPEAASGSRVPVALVSERLADALPGFASGGGGIVAVLTAKAAAAPILAKTAALVAAAILTAGVAGQAIRHTHLLHHRAAAVATSRGGQARVLPVSPTTTTSARRAVVLAVVAPRHSAVVFKAPDPARPSARGGVAKPSSRHATRTKHRSGGKHRGSNSGHHHDGRGSGSGGGDHASGGDDHGNDQAVAQPPTRSGNGGGDHGSSHDGNGSSSGTSDRSGGDGDHGGRGGGHDGSGDRHGSHSDDGGAASTATTPAIAVPTTTGGGDNGGDGSHGGGGGSSGGKSTDGDGSGPPVTSTEPVTTEPVTTEPVATEPATTEPATTEPVSTTSG